MTREIIEAVGSEIPVAEAPVNIRMRALLRKQRRHWIVEGLPYKGGG